MTTTLVRSPRANDSTQRNYPLHLAHTWHLENGNSMTIRPVLPRDDALTAAFVRKLSTESRYSRFLAELSELPQTMLVYLTDIDYIRHMGLIALTRIGDKELQVGEARYVIEPPLPDSRNTAEIAIAVADDWQATGIGSRLLRMLEKVALARGITQFSGDVLGSNRKALDFMRQRGFAIHPNRSEARLVRVLKSL